MVDLILGHAGALSGTQTALLLLTPFIDESEILRIASQEISIERLGPTYIVLNLHMDQSVEFAN